MNHGGGHSVLPVDLQPGRGGGGPVKDPGLPVHPEGEGPPVPAQKVGVGVAVHHQQLHHREASAAEQLGGGAVELDLAAVADQPQPRRGRDAQRGGVGGVVQVQRVGTDGVLEMVARHSHPLGVHFQGFGQPFPQAGQLAAASRQEHGRGGGAVDLQNLFGDLPGQRFRGRGRRGGHLLCRLALGNPQHVGEFQRAPLGQGGLEGLGGLKIHQIRLHQRLGDLVPRHGGHGVSHHAAPTADGDVGGAGPDVHHAQVQQPELLGDGGVQGRDGLEGQAFHLQPGLTDHRVQAVDDPAGEEGGHYVRRKAFAGMLQQVDQRVAVQLVAGGGVAHQQHPLDAVVVVVELGLGVGHGGGFELGDPGLTDRLGGRLLQGAVALFGAQGPACGGHTGPLQAAPGGGFQPGGDLPHGGGHLGNVLDLAVQHHTPGVKPGFHRLNLHPFPGPGRQQADDAAGADVQGVDQILRLAGKGSGAFLLDHGSGSLLA